MPYCMKCGTETKEGYEFCPECGTMVSIDVIGGEVNLNYRSDIDKYRICKICGKKVPEDVFYCLECGTTFDSLQSDLGKIKDRVSNIGKSHKGCADTSVGVWKNKWVAMMLCVFFGILGMHRFYEEKKITGFIYLFTFGLLGMGWFFDIILIATKTNPYRVK